MNIKPNNMIEKRIEEVAKFIAQKAQDFPLDELPFVNWRVNVSSKNDKIILEGGVIIIGYMIQNDDSDKKESVIVGQCLISPLKGCNGVAIVSSLKIEEEYRNKGLATYLIDLVNVICNKISYSYIICTTKEENMAMRSALAKNQYKELFEFNNRKTENDIVFVARNLSDYNNIVSYNIKKRSVIIAINSSENI